VLFGGLLGFAPQAETWLWNGKSWRHAQTGLAPPPRFDYGMVFDAARRVVLLFGGRDLGASLQDTWTWNGAAWSRLQVAGPSARSALGMAYDSRRQRTVLFGGANLTGAASALAFGDTWEWDGAVWTRCQPAQAPSPRAYPTMAYDEGTHTTVCLGGSVAGVRLCEVWQWDGVQWTGGPGGPPSMVAQQLVYDRRRDQLVLLTPVVAGDSLQGTSVWIGSPRVATAALDGQRCGGALGLTLRPFGMPRVDRKSVRIDVLGAQYGQPVMLGGGLPAAPVAIGGGCAFWLLNGTGTLQGLAGGVGNLDLAVPLPDAAALLGLEVVFQAGALDPTAPLGFALSEGLRLRIGE
jgi:hypothetical protein